MPSLSIVRFPITTDTQLSFELVLSKDSGETEIRRLPKGESFFWLHPSELNEGVIVMITDAAGIIRQHSLLAA